MLSLARFCRPASAIHYPSVTRFARQQRRSVQSNVEGDEPPESSRGGLNALEGMVRGMAHLDPRDSLNPSEPSPTVQMHTLLRPYDLNREKGTHQPKRRWVPRICPGREARYKDVFLQLSIDPRYECENGELLKNFVTNMGKIQSRAETGLSVRSQRLLTKAIKRARMMGVLSMFSNRTSR